VVLSCTGKMKECRISISVPTLVIVFNKSNIYILYSAVSHYWEYRNEMLIKKNVLYRDLQIYICYKVPLFEGLTNNFGL
jgi:hypothetical protein